MYCGIIGCGRIAVKHAAAIKNNAIQLVAVCDLIESKMDDFLQKYGEQSYPIQKYTDYREMLDSEKELDFVAVATDSGKHFEIASESIKKGFGVIVEKPMSLSMKDVNELIHLSEKYENKFIVCLQNRYNPAVQATKRAIELGRLGKISHIVLNVRWNREKEYYQQAAWRGTWMSDGGALMNQGIHGIDLLLWLIGSRPVSVCGVVSQRFHSYMEAEDMGCAIIKFENGVIGMIEGTTNIYKENFEESICIFGENGIIKIGGKSLNKIEKWDFKNELEEDKEISQIEERVGNVYGNGHNAIYRNMKEVILGNASSDIDLAEGKKGVEIILAIYKSCKEKRWVSLPLLEFQTNDMYGFFE